VGLGDEGKDAPALVGGEFPRRDLRRGWNFGYAESVAHGKLLMRSGTYHEFTSGAC
jgi:hypothetical protein